MSRTVEFVVFGVPQPQGNKTPMLVHGRPIVVEGRRPEARAAFKDWRAAVSACARLWLAQNGSPAPIDGPVQFEIDFYVPRPKSAPKRLVYPLSRPDIDKLTRSCADSLSKIIYVDDSRIVNLFIRKRFAIDAPPRAEIRVTEVA